MSRGCLVWDRNVLLFFVWNVQTVKLIFGRSFIFCTFVCNHGALNLHLQVLALPASVTMVRPTKTSQKLNIYRLYLLDQVFDSYKSNNVFFRFTFFYFGAISQSLSFLDSVVRCGWFHLGRWSFQMLRVYWRRKRSPCSSDIPALKLGRFFVGIAAETTAAIFQLNAANAANFPVKRP